MRKALIILFAIMCAAFVACSPEIPLDKTELSLESVYRKGLSRSISWTAGDTAWVRVL